MIYPALSPLSASTTLWNYLLSSTPGFSPSTLATMPLGLGLATSTLPSILPTPLRPRKSTRPKHVKGFAPLIPNMESSQSSRHFPRTPSLNPPHKLNPTKCISIYPTRASSTLMIWDVYPSNLTVGISTSCSPTTDKSNPPTPKPSNLIVDVIVFPPTTRLWPISSGESTGSTPKFLTMNPALHTVV